MTHAQAIERLMEIERERTDLVRLDKLTRNQAQLEQHTDWLIRLASWKRWPACAWTSPISCTCWRLARSGG